jgi:signal-transduction protein with cAMP-binding, CBS, and nucleotidyltransferase domain
MKLKPGARRWGNAMHIGEICTRSVVTCHRETSARELARLMRERTVGDVVVVDEHEGLLTPVGVVTDRDLVVKVLAMDVDPAVLRAEDLMASNVETAFESELVYDAIWHMRGKSIRRLPVVDAHNHLLGMLTADDVTRFLAQELGDLARVATHQTEREEIALQSNVD